MSDETYSTSWEDLPKSDGPWLRVEGGSLTQPIYIQFGKQGGRRFVSALHMQNGEEIRGSDLRFPIGRVADAAMRQIAPDLPEFLEAMQMDGEPSDPSLAAAEWVSSQVMVGAATSVAEPKRPRGRGAPPPSEQELRDFSKVYLAELAARPHGAMTRATKSFKMGRPTGYRWLARCRELGIIPEES